MRPLVGRRLDGATLALVDELGGVGTPCWGPTGLLRDLSLRLGLPIKSAPSSAQDAARVAAFARRMARLVAREAFYAKSFEMDPIGTAEMVLSWRDTLVEAGWDGERVAGGGPRLDALAELEEHDDPLPSGAADHLAAAEVALLMLHQQHRPPYESIEITDDIDAWPGRWRRVFSLLQQAGTQILRPSEPSGGAEPGSDLDHLHRVLLDGRGATPSSEVRGDGSLVFLEAPTTQQAADTVAALVNEWGSPAPVFIRGGERSALDHALRAHGIATLGDARPSRDRAAIQLVTALVDLAFAPLDPHRVLELFDLTFSPFVAPVRRSMARALADAPGIGDVRWQSAKRRLVEAGHSIAPIEAWIERARWDGDHGAPTADLLELVERIGLWLQSHIAPTRSEVVVATLERCAQLADLLRREERPTLPRIAMRRLVDLVFSEGISASVSTEQCGRPHHVDHPGAVVLPCSNLVWWHFVAASTRLPHRARFRHNELTALAAAGVRLVAPETLLAEEAWQWRAAALRARQRLVMVVPAWNRGERMAPHPFHDEIVARLMLDERALGRITVSGADVLARRHWHVDVEHMAPLPLPAARPAWHVSPGITIGDGSFTPRSLQTLVECPLRWALEHRPGQRARRVPAIPHGAQVNGLLAHRLVQYLAQAGSLNADPATIRAAIDRLVPGIAAQLLLPGMSFELHQLRHQLTVAVMALARLLEANAMTIEAVEEDLAAAWMGVNLVGRLDLRLRRADGRDAVLDLKWGRGKHRKDLETGRALQLAVYALALHLRAPAGPAPSTAYFAMAQGTLLTTEPGAFGLRESVNGPPVGEAIERLARTVPAVRTTLAAGTIPVTGLRTSLPLLEAIGIPRAEREQHLELEPGDGCAHCSLGAVCGRDWEELA
ncbi:MAG: PD-(D/E)XK nuclease family protein [Kofleriaceae bacterium]|nr:MAG: PD-(D/E)XK nuclease family protein [Kofleriaceae bacterium]